ncbi:MAG: hypothetical protein RLZZ217_1754 [Planctomycetota bacterium]|jgi:hypothetical protein
MNAIVALAVVVSLVPTDQPLLGPIWGGDSSEDAGATPGSSQSVKLIAASGTSIGLTKIVGATAPLGLTASDTVDMYEVTVDGSSAFAINTGDPSFDTVLYLFRRVELADGTIEALPIVANDNASQQTIGSAIARPEGGQIPGLTSGRYFLAVAPAGCRPVGILPGGALSGLFEFPANDGTGLAFPFPNLASTPLVDWTVGEQSGGPYEVNVAGGVIAERPTRCEEAPVLGLGSHPFGNPMPFPEDPSALGLGNSCGTPGYLFSPNWFRTEACDGTVTISLCVHDADANPYGLIVYRGGCGNLQPVACAESLRDAGDCAQVVSVSFESSGCSDILVAFGPRVLPEGGDVIGSDGWIDIACTPGPQGADLNGDGVVNGVDLCLLLVKWTGADDDHGQ